MLGGARASGLFALAKRPSRTHDACSIVGAALCWIERASWTRPAGRGAFGAVVTGRTRARARCVALKANLIAIAEASG